MWQYEFVGVCLGCRRWMELIIEGPAGDIGKYNSLQWWQVCPFCGWMSGRNTQTVAFRFFGGHLLEDVSSGSGS